MGGWERGGRDMYLIDMYFIEMYFMHVIYLITCVILRVCVFVSSVV